MSDLKSIPTGVKIIAVLAYIQAGFELVGGLLFLFGAGAMGSVINQIPLLGMFGASLFFILGIIFVGFAILSFFIGRGLWKLKKWARVLVIIFSFLGVLMAIISIIAGGIPSGIFSLAVEGLIGGYLLFSKEVKQTFA